MHPRVGPIEDADGAAIVGLPIAALNRGLARSLLSTLMQRWRAASVIVGLKKPVSRRANEVRAAMRSQAIHVFRLSWTGFPSASFFRRSLAALFRGQEFHVIGIP
jgi:hypothetical protein